MNCKYIRYFTICSAFVFCTFTYAKEYKWKMATSWSGGVNFEVGAKAFAEKINYLSDGKINIQAFPGGTLGKAFKVSGTVKNGVAQIGHSWMGYDWGKDKTTVLFGGWADRWIQKRCSTGSMKQVVLSCGNNTD